MKLSKSAIETPQMLHEAFAEHCLSRTAVFEWHSSFKACQVSVEYHESSGRPSTSKTTDDVGKIWELIHKDYRRTIHELSGTDGISYGVCQILTENFNMHCNATKFVPRLLTNDQKQWWVTTQFVTTSSLLTGLSLL
jgi:hypothetical protein